MPDRSSAGWRRADVVAILVVFTIVTVAFADVIFLGHGWFRRDLLSFYYPTKSLIRDLMLHGEFPSWNRAYGAGQPMAANPEYEIFYPPQLLILIGPYDFGFRLHILFHFYLAAAGMYVLLRSLSLRALSAAFGAASFALGGLALSSIALLTTLFPLAWMPLLLWAARRAFHKPGRASCAAAAFILGMIGLVGEPVALLESLCLVGGYGLYFVVRSGERHWRPALVVASVIVVGGIAVAAVQIIPAWDLLRDTIRSRGFRPEMSRYWSMPFARLGELLVPNLFGAVDNSRSLMRMGAIYPVELEPYYFCLYPGLLVTILFVAGLALRLRGAAIFLAVLAVSIVAAVGAHTPLFDVALSLPLFHSVRYFEKFIVVAALVLPIQAAMTLELVLAGDERVRRGVMRIAVAVCALSAGAAIALVIVHRAAPGADFMRTAVLSGAIVAALSLTLTRPRVAVPMLLLVLLADLLPLSHAIAPRLPRRFFTEMPVAAHNVSGGRYRIFHEADWHRHSATGRRYFSSAEVVPYRWKAGLFPMTGARWGVQSVFDPDIDQTLLLPSADLLSALLARKQGNDISGEDAILTMSNVRWRAFFRPWEIDVSEFGGEAGRSQPTIFVGRKTNERYYFADTLIPCRTPAEFVSNIHAATPRAALADLPAQLLSPGRVERWSESGHEAHVIVDVPAGRALLVASVTRHRYWHARIDGADTRIHPLNLAYQGIFVGPGRHEVVFSYWNSLLAVSGVISIAMTLLILLLLAKAAVFEGRATDDRDTTSQAMP